MLKANCQADGLIFFFFLNRQTICHVCLCLSSRLLDWTVVLLVFIACCLVGVGKFARLQRKKERKKWPTLELGGSII